MANEQVEEPTPSTSKEVEFDVDAVNSLFAKGKRHYVCQETHLALECFAEVCDKLSNKYGQTANECADAYLYYGKTLLDLARMENGVLGNALKQGPDMEEDDEEDLPNQEGPSLKEIPEEEREEVRLKVQEAMSEDVRLQEEVEKQEKKSDENEEEQKEEQESEGNEEEEEEEEVEEECEEEEKKGEETEGEKGDDSEKEEEVSNMQLSWEMLELSKLISARQDTKEAKLRQAEAAMGLGEINLESEHYPEAIGDFSECYRLQESVLEADDRRLAETNYNLALAYSFDKQFDKSISYFRKAIDVIENRVKNLEKQLKDKEQDSDGKGKEKASDAVEKLRKEVKELQDLIPDMAGKIEDAEEMKKSDQENTEAIKKFAQEALGVSSPFDKPSEEEAKPMQASNITHLVRKKRKPEEEAEDKTVECKKSKVVETNGHANGVPK